ncbi:MAG: ParB/RepB/Spo0J family partition protein [Gaiellaceae bacterium]
MSQDPARRGLGRGLELLMGPSSTEAELVQLPIGSIVPGRFQPRRRFNEEALAELTESIRLQGVVQPVLVRPVGGGYELIAGERRWRAAQAAGLATVPAVIREGDDTSALLLAMLENVAREDLSPIEEARGYAALLEEFDLGLGEIASKVGRSKPTVSNRIRMLELPDDVIELVETGKLSECHARAVLAVPDHEERRRLARRIVRDGLSVRAAEQAAKQAGARQRTRRNALRLDPALLARARELLERASGAHVRVHGSSFTLAPTDETALAEIVEALERCVGDSADDD